MISFLIIFGVSKGAKGLIDIFEELRISGCVEKGFGEKSLSGSIDAVGEGPLDEGAEGRRRPFPNHGSHTFEQVFRQRVRDLAHSLACHQRRPQSIVIFYGMNGNTFHPPTPPNQ